MSEIRKITDRFAQRYGIVAAVIFIAAASVVAVGFDFDVTETLEVLVTGVLLVGVMGIVAGIASLWGPAHGGANEAVLQMLQEIGSKERIPEFIERAKNKDDPFRLMGFGHRVYKHYDPRAAVLRESCHEVLDELGKRDEPLLDLAMELERIALEDDYFVEKKLFPNVDFYSGIILQAMGFPTTMFTVLFALARTVGWVAQWKEMVEDPHHRISRPRQLYTGHAKRDFVPIDQRG